MCTWHGLEVQLPTTASPAEPTIEDLLTIVTDHASAVESAEQNARDEARIQTGETAAQ